MSSQLTVALDNSQKGELKNFQLFYCLSKGAFNFFIDIFKIYLLIFMFF